MLGALASSRLQALCFISASHFVNVRLSPPFVRALKMRETAIKLAKNVLLQEIYLARASAISVLSRLVV